MHEFFSAKVVVLFTYLLFHKKSNLQYLTLLPAVIASDGTLTHSGQKPQPSLKEFVQNNNCMF